METTENTPRQNKYNYERIIQQNCEYGWEDVSSYEANSQGQPKEYTKTKEGKKISLYRYDLKEYIFSGTGATRGIFKKTLNTIN